MSKSLPTGGQANAKHNVKFQSPEFCYLSFGFNLNFEL
jgi:hypothetical protein